MFSIRAKRIFRSSHCRCSTKKAVCQNQTVIKIVWYCDIWSNGLVVMALDSQSRGPGCNTSGWFQVWRSLLPIRGRNWLPEVLSRSLALHACFYKQRFFSTEPQCCLTFSWIELQMFLRCCLIHISIIILRHFLYLPYLCPCLGLGLFVVFMWSIFYFHPHFRHDSLFNLSFLRIFPVSFRWERWWRIWIIFKCQKFSLGVLLSICLIFNQFQRGVACKISVCSVEKNTAMEKRKILIYISLNYL